MEKQSPLFSISFSDLYLRIDREAIQLDQEINSYYKPKKSFGVEAHPTLTLPPETIPEVASLRKKVQALYEKDVARHKEGNLRLDEVGSFSFTFNGQRMRACTLETVSPVTLDDDGRGQVWACVRQLNSVCPTLTTIELPVVEKEVLKALHKRKGLILISGPTGAGKSTTGLALMENNMSVGEGTGLFFEDPCEFIMQGEFKPGRSLILQNEVRSTEGWVDGARRALRFAPDYCYIGELRDPLAVAQVLRLAATGHQVVATIHAGSIEQAISSVLHITRSVLGDLAPQLLADCLTAVFNQRFEGGKVGMTSLSVEDVLSDPVRVAIRDANLATLKNVIESQSNKREASATQTMQRPRSPNPATPSGQRPARPEGLAPRRAPQPQQRQEPPKPKGFFGIMKKK